jgi:hypothetical protein
MIRKGNYNNNANKKGVIIKYKTWAANIILGRKRKKIHWRLIFASLWVWFHYQKKFTEMVLTPLQEVACIVKATTWKTNQTKYHEVSILSL